MIPERHKHNFETLQRAGENGHLALLECADAATGEPVFTIVAVQTTPSLVIGGEPDYTFVPLARMFDGNPYEAVIPPQLEKTQ